MDLSNEKVNVRQGQADPDDETPHHPQKGTEKGCGTECCKGRSETGQSRKKKTQTRKKYEEGPHSVRTTMGTIKITKEERRKKRLVQESFVSRGNGLFKKEKSFHPERTEPEELGRRLPSEKHKGIPPACASLQRESVGKRDQYAVPAQNLDV